MTLADFELYIHGLVERERMDQENLLAHAHTTASFVIAGLNGKLKPVDKYLPQDIPVVQGEYSLDKAREQLARIDKAMLDPVYLDFDEVLREG